MGKAGGLAKERAVALPRPPPSFEHPTASALSVSLLSAWIVARLRRRNFKRLQGQDRQSVMSEKLVGGMEGRPGAGQGGGGEDMIQGCSPLPHLSSLRKRPPFSRPLSKPGQLGRAMEALGGHWTRSPPPSIDSPNGPK